MRKAESYLELGQPMTFYTVTEACRRRGEVAIGYVRKRAGIEADPRNMGGVVVNPKKSETLTYEAGDRIIVSGAGTEPERHERRAKGCRRIEVGHMSAALDIAAMPTIGLPADGARDAQRPKRFTAHPRRSAAPARGDILLRHRLRSRSLLREHGREALRATSGRTSAQHLLDQMAALVGRAK